MTHQRKAVLAAGAVLAGVTILAMRRSKAHRVSQTLRAARPQWPIACPVPRHLDARPGPGPQARRALPPPCGAALHLGPEPRRIPGRSSTAAHRP